MREFREKIQKLRSYYLLRSFNFLQLTYLAQLYQEKTIIFKDYLYKQGQTPQEVYLIQEGDFQFTKFIEDNEQNETRTKVKEKIQRKKNISKEKKMAADFQQGSMYNVIKPPKKKQFKVGTVAGGLGQSIGDEEIVLNKQRRVYNAKCMSTNNKVIVIRKQNLLKILEGNPQLLAKLSFQLGEKQKVTHKVHQKMQSVRTNMGNFVKMLDTQILKEKTKGQSTQRINMDETLKLPSLDRRNFSDMTRVKASLKPKFSLRASNESLLDRTQPSKIKYHNLKSEADENGGTFALTAFDQQEPEMKRKLDLKLSKIEEKHQTIPMNDNSMKLNLTIQKQNEITHKRLLSKQKYTGMVDSSALVNEKQFIMEMKRNPNQISDRVEFQQRHKKLWKKALLDKERAKQSSTTHSKQFMEQMLLNALRKAGYQEAIPHLKKNTQFTDDKTTLTQDEPLEISIPTQDSQNTNNYTRNLKIQKTANKMKKKRKAFFQPISQVLENNPFDECYFGKII